MLLIQKATSKEDERKKKMKYKTTKKEMKKNYYTIIGTGYCELQNLLRRQEANSYCVSTYGWACDNYELIGSKGQPILLSTGYNPIRNQNINKTNTKINEIIKKYESKAEKINNTHEIQKKLSTLISDFVDEILESEAK